MTGLVCCNPSLELSHRLNEGPQHIFFVEKEEKVSVNIPQYPLLSEALIMGLLFLFFPYKTYTVTPHESQRKCPLYTPVKPEISEILFEKV